MLCDSNNPKPYDNLRFWSLLFLVEVSSKFCNRKAEITLQMTSPLTKSNTFRLSDDTKKFTFRREYNSIKTLIIKQLLFTKVYRYALPAFCWRILLIYLCTANRKIVFMPTPFRI